MLLFSSFFLLPFTHLNSSLPSVSGYILANVFYGSIFINSDIYYVDPSKVGEGAVCCYKIHLTEVASF